MGDTGDVSYTITVPATQASLVSSTLAAKSASEASSAINLALARVGGPSVSVPVGLLHLLKPVRWLRAVCR